MNRSRRGKSSLMLAGLCFLAACGSTPAPVVPTGEGEVAAEALRDAASATLDLDSFHVELTESIPSSDPPGGTVDYKAPDMKIEHLGTNVTISIGEDTYVSIPNRPGYFWRGNLRDAIGVGDTLGPIRWAKEAANVRFDGHTYAFDLPPSFFGSVGVATVETTISRGLLDTLTLSYSLPLDEGDVSMALAYSRFNEPVSVEAPSADHIVKGTPFSTCSSPPSSRGSVVTFCPSPQPGPTLSP